MNDKTYHCTACNLNFPRLGSLAAHIQKTHSPQHYEDELEQRRRRTLNLPDDDDDDDDDEAEDELLPSTPRDAELKIEHLRRVSSAMIAERNIKALEPILAELERLEIHWELCANVFALRRREVGSVRKLVSWVVHDACEANA